MRIRVSLRLSARLAALCTVMPAAVFAQSPAPPIVLQGVNVLEGPELQPRLGVNVVIVDGQVADIAPGAATPAGARVLDFEGYWVVPGLIDAHSHLNTLDAARRGG